MFNFFCAVPATIEMNPLNEPSTVLLFILVKLTGVGKRSVDSSFNVDFNRMITMNTMV